MTPICSLLKKHNPGDQPSSKGCLAFHMLAACLLSFLAPTMATADQALIQDNGDGNGATVGAVAVTYDESSITVTFTTDEPY